MNKKQRRELEKNMKAVAAKSATKPASSGTEVKASTAEKKVTTKKVANVVASGAMPPLPKMPSSKRSRKPKPFVDCTCGCGGKTQSEWVPGHDARARGWAIRIERGICKLSEVPENEQPGAKHFLKLRKELGTEGKITLAKGKKGEVAAASTEQAATAVNQ